MLMPAGWFTTGQQAEIHIWAPALAAALDVLDLLANSRVKQPHQVQHVVLISRILYNEEWRRLLVYDLSG